MTTREELKEVEENGFRFECDKGLHIQLLTERLRLLQFLGIHRVTIKQYNSAGLNFMDIIPATNESEDVFKAGNL